mgnify:CR=1 FL=1
MVVKLHIKQVADRAAGAVFAVRSAENDPGDPGVQNGAGAHGAGLQGHIQGAIPQSPAAQVAASLVNGL